MSFEAVEDEIPKTLENIVGSPFNFRLKDGTILGLGEWTIEAELWAKANFGSMEKLFNILMNIDCDDTDTIDASVRVAIYKLTPESKQIVRELIKAHNANIKDLDPVDAKDDPFAEEDTLTAADNHVHNVRQFFSKYITYAQLAELCRAEYRMIRDSIPLEALEEVKKSHLKTMETLQGNRAVRRKPTARTKKSGKKKSAKK